VSALVAAHAGALGRHGRDRVANATVVGFCLGLAWGLKRFYSQAGCDDLLWILTPTTRLVQWLTGAVFELEAGHGFLSRDRLYQIVASCAGVNFMIACFCSLSCGLVHTRSTWSGRLVWVALSALSAYGITVLANAVRIAIAVPMHAAAVSWGPLTGQRLHGAEGVVVYFFFLCATFAVAARMTGAGRELVV
jgi:exosortase K